MSDAGYAQSASIADIVDEVISADVAAYGVGFPEKVPPPPPPPPVTVPDDGWRVDEPGTTPVFPEHRRLPLWPALLVAVLLVVAGLLKAFTGTTTPTTPSTPTTSASASAQAACADAPAAAPIVAVFTQATFSTSYTTNISAASGCAPTLQWSGPDCGSFTPQGIQTASGPTRTVIVWQHPHPPCDPTTDHANVTVVLTVSDAAGTVRCTYQGAASGTGPACVKQ